MSDLLLILAAIVFALGAFIGGESNNKFTVRPVALGLLLLTLSLLVGDGNLRLERD